MESGAEGIFRALQVLGTDDGGGLDDGVGLSGSGNGLVVSACRLTAPDHVALA